jgi:hypothetical protein
VRPPRLVIYGPEGIGKSTLAAQAPNPVFIQTEEGLDALDVTAFPLAIEYSQVEDALSSLINEDHDFQTLAVDSLDWLERLILRAVAAEGNVLSIEDIPYGKGYKLAIEKWRTVLEGFDILRNDKHMTIVLLAHSKIKRFEDPISDSYDQYRVDLHDAAAALVDEWCDVIGFLTQHVGIKSRDTGFGKKEIKGVGGGERILYTEGRPSYIAKSRYTIPSSLSIPRIGGFTVIENAIAASLNQGDASSTGSGAGVMQSSEPAPAGGSKKTTKSGNGSESKAA